MVRKMDDDAGKPTIFEQPAIQAREDKEKEEKRKMNIYQKINALRMEILKAPLKKTGWNDFQKFPYFELKDFLPTVLAKCDELGLTGQDRVYEGMAILTFTNSEDPTDEKVEFSVPFVMSNTSKNKVQDLGATITYIRRYLWQVALELVENDIVDAQDQNAQPIQPKVAKAGKEQIAQIQALYTPAQIASMLQKKGYNTIADFSWQDAEQAINFKTKENA